MRSTVEVYSSSPSTKVGDYIRLNEALHKPSSSKLLLSAFDIVQVLKVDKNGQPVRVRSILEEDFSLPDNFPYEKVKSGRIQAATSLSGSVKGTHREELTADRGQTNQNRAFSTRALHKLQAVVSNAKITEDPLVAARMAVASTCLLLSAMPGTTTNHSARAIALANKLLSQG